MARRQVARLPRVARQVVQPAVARAADGHAPVAAAQRAQRRRQGRRVQVRVQAAQQAEQARARSVVLGDERAAGGSVRRRRGRRRRRRGGHAARRAVAARAAAHDTARAAPRAAAQQRPRVRRRRRRRRRARQLEDRREEVDQLHRRRHAPGRKDEAARRLGQRGRRRAHHQGHAEHRFVHRELVLHEPVVAQVLAVVRGDDQHAVVVQAVALQELDQAVEQAVRRVDVAAVQPAHALPVHELRRVQAGAVLVPPLDAHLVAGRQVGQVRAPVVGRRVVRQVRLEEVDEHEARPPPVVRVQPLAHQGQHVAAALVAERADQLVQRADRRLVPLAEAAQQVRGAVGQPRVAVEGRRAVAVREQQLRRGRQRRLQAGVGRGAAVLAGQQAGEERGVRRHRPRRVGPRLRVAGPLGGQAVERRREGGGGAGGAGAGARRGGESGGGRAEWSGRAGLRGRGLRRRRRPGVVAPHRVQDHEHDARAWRDARAAGGERRDHRQRQDGEQGERDGPGQPAGRGPERGRPRRAPRRSDLGCHARLLGLEARAGTAARAPNLRGDRGRRQGAGPKAALAARWR